MKLKAFVCVCSLALIAPWGESELIAQTPKPKAAGKPIIAETATISPEAQQSLLADVQRAQKLLTDGKVETFVDDYFPLENLRELRKEKRSAAEAAVFLKQSPHLVKFLKELLAQVESGSWDGTNDEVTVSSVPAAEPETPAAKPEKLVQAPSTEGVKGYGGDFSKVLKAWIEDLQAKRYAEFVSAALPASEVARLEAAGEIDAVVQVFEVHANVATAILADLQAVAKLDPEANGNLIKVMLPGRLQGDPEREIRFQKLAEDWRFYDQTSEVQATLYPVLNGQVKIAVSTPEATTLLTFERIREHWRIRQLPPPPPAEGR